MTKRGPTRSSRPTKISSATCTHWEIHHIHELTRPPEKSIPNGTPLWGFSQTYILCTGALDLVIQSPCIQPINPRPFQMLATDSNTKHQISHHDQLSSINSNISVNTAWYRFHKQGWETQPASEGCWYM
jgi:hypothetical protein